MTKIGSIIKSLRQKPRYTLMRGLGRFGIVRSSIAQARAVLQYSRVRKHITKCNDCMRDTNFSGLDPKLFSEELNRKGVAFGMTLPAQTVRLIREWAETNNCYADRNPAHGFLLKDRAAAEDALGKPILVAQYFNTSTQCPAVAELLRDPFIQSLAAHYLGSMPTLAGTNLWWTFPVNASEADRDRHAHLFHRDVDDFRFFKLFFYITDVNPGDGAHVCVSESQFNPPLFKRGDQWNIRRYSDNEINNYYTKDRIHEICGPAGTGFAEDTLCIHKGLTPTHTPRLLLQIQYALFDYGVMNDRRISGDLHNITANKA